MRCEQSENELVVDIAKEVGGIIEGGKWLAKKLMERRCYPDINRAVAQGQRSLVTLCDRGIFVKKFIAVNKCLYALVEYLGRDQDGAFELEKQEDIERINNDCNISSFSKKILVDARRGQGQYRQDVLALWGDCCAITTGSLVDACHLKPWRESTTEEKLDPHNGLPLTPNYHRALDKGWFSINPDGRMIVASNVSLRDRKAYDLIDGLPLQRRPDEAHQKYFANHRLKHGFDKF